MNRQILITLLLSVFIALLGIGIIIPVMPVFATELGANGLALGMIIAVFSVSRGILQPVIGNLSDRLGRRRLMLDAATGKTVETPGHKVPAAVLLEQAAFAHFDTTIPGHIVVGVFDHAISLWIIQFLVPVSAHAISDSSTVRSRMSSRIRSTIR